MTLEEVKEHYKKLIASEKGKLATLKKAIFHIGTIRLAIIIVAIGVCYFLWSNTIIVIGAICLSLIVFLFLLKYHNKLFKQKRYCELQIQNAENELKGINYDFSAFDSAPEKIDPHHSFSLDLDIFGNHSFFQSINRSVTNYGKDRLANTILSPAEDKELIISRQKAIKELSEKPKLSAHFRAVGQMIDTGDLDIQYFSEHFLQTKPLSATLWRFTPHIAIVASVVCLLLYIFDIIPASVFVAYYIIVSMISLSHLKKIVKIKMSLFEKKIETLETYSNLFEIIETENFESDYLKNIQGEVKNHKSASLAIQKLKSYSNDLDQSLTALGMFILNPFLFWNIIYCIKIEKWIQIHKGDIARWFDAIGEFDSLVSLAIFGYNHPEYTYPEIADSYIFEGKDLGHPILNRAVCVRNDVSISRSGYFLIVTGANMAGKSTYLRTVGINHILACIGAPVCAESLLFYPSRLVTNLRTSDSLTDNESYFFAELKRLKMIIDRLQSGEQLFIILDEILKGTNSEDKQKGSIALMKQLLSFNGNGIIATHDLVLGELEKQYPDAVKNYHFDADIKGDNLSFSYEIREGIAQNMNACFLMKKMGITGL